MKSDFGAQPSRRMSFVTRGVSFATLFVASFVSSSEALAAPDALGSCEGKEPAVIREVPFKGQPSFFFRAFPADDIVSFATSEDANRLFDLRTGEEVRIPGSFDPVPLWNERYMVVPINDGGRTQLEFFSVDELRRNKRQTQPVRRNELQGTYQSVGSLPPVEGAEMYRIITSFIGIMSRDYKVHDGKNGQPAIVPVGDPVNLCQGKDLKLPMLSKDGTELAALDGITNTTKIFAVDPARKSCEEVLDLGVATGKVDFSFDGRFLAYHVSKIDLGGGFFVRPDKGWSLQVHVYDRVMGRATIITSDMARNSYFPVFRKDGSLVFLRSDRTGTSYAFAIADFRRGGKISNNGQLSSADIHQKAKATTRAFEMMNALACRSTDVSENEVRQALLSYKSVIERKCQYCHADPSIAIAFFDVAALKKSKPRMTPSAANMAEAIRLRLRGEGGVSRMPMEGTISEEEIQVVLQTIGLAK